MRTQFFFNFIYKMQILQHLEDLLDFLYLSLSVSLLICKFCSYGATISPEFSRRRYALRLLFQLHSKN